MSIFIILSLATSADFVRRIQYAVYPYVSCMVNNTFFVRERQRVGIMGVIQQSIIMMYIKESLERGNVAKTLHYQNSSNIKLEIRKNGQNQVLMMSYI